jgi:hypothetical protein
MSNSTYRQITTIVTVGTTTNGTSTADVFSQNTFPVNIGANTIFYVDGADPLNIAINNGFEILHNGIADISGFNMFLTNSLPFSGTTYPTS